MASVEVIGAECWELDRFTAEMNRSVGVDDDEEKCDTFLRELRDLLE